jgi:hypothetical protein
MNMHNTFDAEKYVTENAYLFSLKDYSTIGKELRCIDDRASNSDDRTCNVAIPGGGLGLVMDTLGAFTLLRRKGLHATLHPDEAVEVVEKAIGSVSFHTDDHSEGHASLCAGCGHAHGALTDPVAYLLTEEDAKYFFEFCLHDLKNKLHEKGMKPTVYKGPHAAQAVMIAEGTEVGLPSVGKSGEAVFVYHKTFHQLLLTLIANGIAPLLKDHTKGISEEDFEKVLHESAEIRLGVTLKKLAVGLPRFLVAHGKNFSVTQA